MAAASSNMLPSSMEEDRKKYEQFQVLLKDPPGFPVDRDASLTYYCTEPPSFEEISQRLYQSIRADTKCGQEILGGADKNKLLNCCFTIPFAHRGPEPTLKEVFDQVPYFPQFARVYVKIAVLPYIIGHLHVSCLRFYVQTGIWVPDAPNSSNATGQYFSGFDWQSPVNFRLNLEKVEHPELIRRFERVVAVKISDDNKVFHVASASLANNIAYLWDTPPESAIIGCFDTTTNNILAPDGTCIATYIDAIPTFHTWAYYGFFKPTFPEVLHQLPNSTLSNPNRKLLVTTDLPEHSNANDVIIGDYHVGKTTIWEIKNGSKLWDLTAQARVLTEGQTASVAPVAPAPAASSSAPVVSAPIDDYNEKLCMVCLNAEPNTMVEPCHHIVVCAKCSKQLEKTHDAHVCVKCREPITGVIYP